MSQIVKTVEIVLVKLGVQMCANSLFKFISIEWTKEISSF